MTTQQRLIDFELTVIHKYNPRYLDLSESKLRAVWHMPLHAYTPNLRYRFGSYCPLEA